MAVSAHSFPVSLHKLTNSVEPEQIFSLHYIAYGSALIVHYINGNVEVLTVEGEGENSTVIDQNILQIRVHCSETTVESKTCEASLLVLGNDYSLTVHYLSINSDQLKVTESNSVKCTKQQLQQILCNDTKEGLPDPSCIHVLSFESSSTTLLFGRSILKLSFNPDIRPELKERIELVWDPKEGSVIDSKLLHGLVFLLHQSGNISVHSLSRRLLVATVHFQKFLHHLYPSATPETLKPLHPDSLDVSPDLQYLILTQQQAKYNIYKLNLTEYFNAYPYHVKVHRSSPQFTSSPGGGREVADEDEMVYMHGRVKVQAVGTPGNRSWLSMLSTASKKLSGGRGSDGGQAEVNWLERVGVTELTHSKLHLTSGVVNSKKLPGRISGFQKPQTRHDSMSSYRPKIHIQTDQEDEACRPSAAVRASKAFRDLKVTEMFVTKNSAALWYRGNTKLDVGRGRYGGVCLLDLATNDIDYHSFTEPVVVTFSQDSSHQYLILCRTGIEALAYGVDQETLVNKLMIYSSASLAETVCHLNHWDHYSIPIHALEVGLKQRQLDTVAFFLKSRENVFKYSPTPSSPTGGAPRSPSPLTADQTQLWSAIDLLITSIRDHIQAHQSRQYAMQLLNLTLAYVNKLIENATETLKVVQQGEGLEVLGGFNLTGTVLKEALVKLMGYVKELWVYLKGCPKWIGAQAKDEAKSEDKVDSVSPNYFEPDGKTAQKYTRKWKKMSQEEVIKDAILGRCLPLAQAHLRSSYGGSEVKVQMSDLADKGLHLMLGSLLQSDLQTATKLLQNMGYNVQTQLKKMCLYTVNSNLRDFLIDHLRQSGSFTTEEEGMITFIHQLERLYTCQSFDKAKALALESGKRKWASMVTPRHSLNAWAQNLLETRLQRGELVMCETPNCENFHYAHIPLEWVRTWDHEIRERVLLDVLIKSKDTSLRPSLDAKSIWSYLTSHCDWKHLSDWIAASNPGSRSKPDHLNPVLTQTLYAHGADELEACPGYLREKILDALASRDIFSSLELEKFNLLLTRLSRTLQLFSDTPFQDNRDLREKFSQWFINLCLKEQLTSVLYLFLDFYRLYLSENEVVSQVSDNRWLEMLLHFRWVGRQTTDPSLMFQASLSNSHLLLGNVQPTISQLFEAGHPVVALATLIYAPGTFSEAMSPALTVEEKIWKVDGEVMKEALKQYPKLQAAVFPPIDVDGVSKQDITVYQLLQGNCPYDPAKLFKWQTTNPMGNKQNGTEMPHFSQAHLVSQYAYTEAFRFTYYLYQGRPSFAYLAFLTSQLQDGGTLTKKRVLQAYLKAYSIAIRHLSNRTIASACVAFVEMLGQDSMSVRIDLQAASAVLERKSTHGDGGGKARKDQEQNLVRMLLACLQGSGNAKELLQLLEDAITYKLNLAKTKLTSWEASEEWTLVILFCRRHQLPLSEVYLIQCASDNQWLHFTCFVQAHQYPKEQVLDLLKKFSSITVREHLHDAFRNLHFGPALIRDDLQGVRQRPLSSQRVRDVKAHYYHRVGFLRRRTADMSSEDDTTCGSDDALSTDDSTTQPTAPLELNISRVPKDLFSVLFECNTSPVPWKSLLAHAVILEEPVLAIIASCYKDCVPLDCLCTWLLTSLDDPTSTAKVTGSMTSVQWHSWTLEELTLIVEVAMTAGLATLLAKGFYIFDKDCALNSFLSFCEAMLVKCDTSRAKICLQDFKAAILKCRRKGISGSGSQSPRTSADFKIGNLKWYEETASAVVLSMVVTSTTYWDTCSLLEVLAHANFSRIVSRQAPDFNKLHKVTQALTDTPIQAEITRLVGVNEPEYTAECNRVLQCLKETKSFKKAKEFASVAGLPVDQVIVEQLLFDLNDLQRSKVWNAESGRMIFWKTCHNTFKANRVSGSTASTFFQNQVNEQKDLHAREKATLLSLAQRWLSNETSAPSQVKAAAERLQQEAWSWRLRAEVEKMETSSVPPSLLEGAFTTGPDDRFGDMDCKCLISEELLYIADVKVDPYSPPILKDEKEVAALNLILGNLLDKCCIKKAYQLAKQFNHYHEDLSIILTSIQLAMGLIAANQMKPDMKRMVAEVGSRSLGGGGGRQSRKMSDAWKGMMSRGMLTRSASTVSMTSMASLDQYEEELDETLNTMESLSANCSSQAKQCCNRVINAYRIGQILGSSYKSVVIQAPFDSLRSILRCSHPQRFAISKTFILANEMTDIQVAGFLCEAVVTSLKARHPKRREGLGATSRFPSSPSLGSYISQDLSEKEEFSQLIQLCRNPAILGNRLLQEATSLVSSDAGNSKSVLTMEVELIVRAHDCHTVCCNMEGISNVLRKCRECSDALTQSEEFTLLVRLLTGVGRYCEMSYVFDVLRANQQFELLFKRGGKDTKLKVALLDYLKRCDPPDTEAYNFVAVKFEMNREIAELLMRDAQEQLQSFNKKAMGANIELQNSLQNVLQDFTKAAQSYAKDNCLRHAEQCVKQARLVALQLHLLPTKQHVINLDSKALTSFMNKHTKFHEALIVADAYGMMQSLWSDAIYHVVVMQGDFQYLEDYSVCKPLDGSLFRDVANKYRQESSRLFQASTNMKKFLSYCSEVLTAYKIATELGFQDLAVNLLEGEAGSYLKDVA
ncbi:spatacsin-like [Asterias rubens]|uniref:spatacsin-like n=1 Tax=Asterias rubens TaxID=7604 RepID=UPI001454FCC4|nr:spatacsin-like [Asterias rubens]